MASGELFWIAFGDIHGHTANLARIPDLEKARAVILTGDLTVKGGVREAGAVVEAVARRNPRVLAQIGNMDFLPVQAWLDEKGYGIHARAVELAPGLGLVAAGWSTPTPFGTPSEAADEQIGQWLEAAYAQASGFDTLVLVSHTPPQGTRADMLGSGAHVGSRAVREFIEKAKPALCITGHIHEARSVDRIGPTVVINPGELAAGGYVRMDYDGRALRAELKNIREAGL